MHRALRFTKELFEYPRLCELAPTTEADNGSITLTDGSIAYMGHKYDAVILLMGDYLSDKAYQTMKAYGESGGNLLTVGAVSKLKSGEDADVTFPSKGQYSECTNGVEIAEKLLSLGIPQMCGKNFCMYENGKKLYTSDGQKNVDNIFQVEVERNGTV